MATIKLGTEEKEVVASVERGDWRSVSGAKAVCKRYSEYAAATFRKDRRVNIRISGKDWDALQIKALDRLPDADIEHHPQVHLRPPARRLKSSHLGLPKLNKQAGILL